jgi:hypothetical protein
MQIRLKWDQSYKNIELQYSEHLELRVIGLTSVSEGGQSFKINFQLDIRVVLLDTNDEVKNKS